MKQNTFFFFQSCNETCGRGRNGANLVFCLPGRRRYEVLSEWRHSTHRNKLHSKSMIFRMHLIYMLYSHIYALNKLNYYATDVTPPQQCHYHYSHVSQCTAIVSGKQEILNKIKNIKNNKSFFHKRVDSSGFAPIYISL